MPIARAASVKFKAFSFPVVKSDSIIPLFSYSVFRVLQRTDVIITTFGALPVGLGFKEGLTDLLFKAYWSGLKCLF